MKGREQQNDNSQILAKTKNQQQLIFNCHSAMHLVHSSFKPQMTVNVKKIKQEN